MNWKFYWTNIGGFREALQATNSAMKSEARSASDELDDGGPAKDINSWIGRSDTG